MALPEYFDVFTELFPEPIIEMLVTSENSFAMINYEQHFDDIHFAITDVLNVLSHKEVADRVLGLYREHIQGTLAAQGIYLSDPLYCKLSDAIVIQHCVSLLATTRLSELLLNNTVSTEDDSVVYFGHIVELIEDLHMTTVLELVRYVSPDLVDYLHRDIPHPVFLNGLEIEAENRFKNANIDYNETTGIVVNYIKSINKFSYSLDVFLAHPELSAELDEASRHVNVEWVINDIILLVLGSSTPEYMLEEITINVVEHIFTEPNTLIKINTAVSKYFSSKGNTNA